jgi:hypothetical protein
MNLCKHQAIPGLCMQCYYTKEMETNKQILVRSYFSYSQMSAYKYSKEKFLRQYYYGEFEESPFLDLGKRLGTALQFRRKPEIEEIESIRKQIPEAKIYEYELKAKLKDIDLLCYFDGFDPKTSELMEFKTGIKPSTASWKNQLLFYSTALFLKFKILPSKITLYYCPTRWNDDDQLVLTGKVQQYHTKITIEEVLLFSKEIIDTYEAIKKLCQEEYEKFGVLPVHKSLTTK